MYGRPMGVAFHAQSNLLFYLDVDMSQLLRVMKVSHTPCDNSPVTRASGRGSGVRLHKPIGLALIGEMAFITDASAAPQHRGVYVVDIKHVAARFNAAVEGSGAVQEEAESSIAAPASGDEFATDLGVLRPATRVTMEQPLRGVQPSGKA